MVNTMLTSTQLVMCYSNDLIDQNIMEHGKLIPQKYLGSPEKAIVEVVEIVRNDFEDRKLNVFLDLKAINNY